MTAKVTADAVACSTVQGTHSGSELTATPTANGLAAAYVGGFVPT